MYVFTRFHARAWTMHCAIPFANTYMLLSVAPEAVWQVGRPPHQSEIWYGGAMPIRDAGISLVLIPKNSLLHYFFHSTSLPITLLIDILIQHIYVLTDLGLHIYCCTGSGGKRPANSM